MFVFPFIQSVFTLKSTRIASIPGEAIATQMRTICPLVRRSNRAAGKAYETRNRKREIAFCEISEKKNICGPAAD